MEKVSQTPHDAVFRQMLMHQAVAKDFLQLYLPAPFLAICELDSLQLVSGSFVEEDLRASIPISFTHCARVMERAMCTR